MDEVGRVERRPAVLTLVSVGTLILTARARTRDVAVSEELLRLGIVVLLALLLDEAPLVIDRTEDLRGMLPVRSTRRTPVGVKGNPEVGKGLADDRIIAVYYVLGADALLLCLDGDGDAMLITPADEEHLFALETQVASIDIGGYVDAGEVPDVHGAVGIGQGGGDEGTLEVLLHPVYLYL